MAGTWKTAIQVRAITGSYVSAWFAGTRSITITPASPPPPTAQIQVSATPVVNGRFDLTLKSILPCPPGTTMVDVFAVGWDGIGYGDLDASGNWTFFQGSLPAPPNDWTFSVRCTGGPPYWVFVYDDVHLTVQ